MFYRQKLILGLLETLEGQLDNIDFQKYLFLYNMVCYQKNEQVYDFVPYKYGCFSFQSYADIRNLKEMGLLKQNNLSLNGNENFVKQLSKDDQIKLLYFKKQYGTKKGKDLIRFVYEKYPYYTLNSEIYDAIMPSTSSRFKIINKEQNQLFTIGYEGKSIDNYLNELILNNVKLVCDVRRNPLSRKYGFSQKSLSSILEALHISYIHLPELGIASSKRGNLNTLNDYNKLFEEYERTTLKNAEKYLEEITRLVGEHKRVALTCFEKDPSMCHRSRVAKALLSRHPELKLKHI